MDKCFNREHFSYNHINKLAILINFNFNFQLQEIKMKTILKY